MSLASIPTAGFYNRDAHAEKPGKPNFLVILVDDMGYSDIAPYGGEIQTPNLSKLSENGIRFTQFYNTGRCCPTRASLMSGLYPHQAGVGHMMDDRGLDGYRGEINRNCVTIAEVLKEANYSTYMSGKWHLTKSTIAKTEEDKHNWPRQRGFDRFYGTITGAGDFWKPKALTIDNTQPDLEKLPDDFYYTDAIAENASLFIREHKTKQPGKPFFCYTAFTAYAAMVTEMDRGVGQIVDTLKQTGQLDNTIIFFMADNGGCAEGGVLGRLHLKTKDARPGGPDSNSRLGGAWANVNNTPFRWYKHHVHEGGSATPLIIHWPSGIKKERNNSFYRQPGHLIDIMATCIDLGKADYPKEYKGKKILPMEGRSLKPSFFDKPVKRDAIYWEHEGHCAIRIEDWKLVSLEKDQAWELYDLSKDRSELDDLKDKHPERLKEMADNWTAWARRANVMPWPGPKKKKGKKRKAKR